MSNTMSFFAPPSVPEVISCRSGNSYTVGNSLVTGVQPEDFLDVAQAGCVPISQLGNGSAPIQDQGNVARSVYSSPTGNNPAATGADNVMAVYSIPANSFDTAGRGLNVTAQGLLAATANSKRVKIIYNPASATVGSTVGTGGTTVADTGATTASGLGWQLMANIFKTGTLNSNTQYAQESATVIGTVHGGIGVPLYPTATENAAILVAVTGNATTATSDISLNFFEVNADN